MAAHQYDLRSSPQQVQQRNPDPVGGTMPMPAVSDFAFPKAPPTVIERAEVAANQALQMSAPWIRPIARVFLLSTFLEDAVRMATQWETQANHINTEWDAPEWVGNSFVACNLVFQVLPSFAIMINGVLKVPNWVILTSIITLIVVVLAQSVAYHVLWNVEFFFRNLAVIGALCLVGAEAADPEPTKGGLLDRDISEVEEEAEVSDVLRLSGRLLVILMFVTLTKFDTVARIITELVGMLLLALLVIGFKTRLSAVSLFLLLTVENLTLNDFFMHDVDDHMHDYKKFNFFQALTVTGGLMMLVALGPGSVSLDGEDKKNL